nr:uncharacterized protein LOC128680953 [Plodia interpunctella]
MTTRTLHIFFICPVFLFLATHVMSQETSTLTPTSTSTQLAQEVSPVDYHDQTESHEETTPITYLPPTEYIPTSPTISTSAETEYTTSSTTTPALPTTTEAVQISCTCPEIYDPVCASNGKSFFNVCQLNCEISAGATLSVVYVGKCVPF